MSFLRGKKLFLKVFVGVALAVLSVEAPMLIQKLRGIEAEMASEALQGLEQRGKVLTASRSGIDDLIRKIEGDFGGDPSFSAELWGVGGRLAVVPPSPSSGDEESSEIPIDQSPWYIRDVWQERTPRSDEADGFRWAFPVLDSREELVGVLALSRSRAGFDAGREESIGREVRLTLLRWVLVSSFLVLFLFITVIRPVKKIIHANETAARGDLRHAYIPRSKQPRDEFGEIMDSHNRMLRKFQTSRFIIRENNKVIQSINEKKTEANRRLKELDRLKSEFLANMSHELRTPLNAIIGFTELTLKTADGLSDRDRRNLELVVQQARSLLQLINEILDLSKIESGRMDVLVEAFPLADLVEDCVASVEPLAREKSLALEIDVEPGVPAEVLTDRTKVRQILLNLLSNAVKFTPEGSVRVRVKLDDSGDGGADAWWLALEVQDTGIGIEESQRDLVFEEFRQVDGSTTRRYPGTGLGLSIARKLAHLLGGDLELASWVDVGSTFTLRLPACHPLAVEDGAAVQSESP